MMQFISRAVRYSFVQRGYCSKNIPKNVLEPNQTSHLQPENGVIFDKKPFKIHLEQVRSHSTQLRSQVTQFIFGKRELPYKSFNLHYKKGVPSKEQRKDNKIKPS
ncbi:uncharacterized protein LOC142239472 [Haematobia irritans]|uniref:uncharacterized protein LOC142239472 n=1 Tax=Haematobia irritans TaxID=7368 RepID=UPI003F5035EB